MRVAGLLVAVALIALAQPSIAQVHVVDGDTIEVGTTTYRIFGIDAPEAGQTCARGGGGTWSCGKAATAAMEALVADGEPSCDDRGVDEFDRVLSVCTVDGVDIGAEMVRQGLAWSFRKYAHLYDELEDSVRPSGVGVWQAETETPWDYRAARWEVAEQEAPDGCPIKGNISKNGHIYHAPWSPWYGRTKVSVEKGERWFCSEREALDAGWRAPRWGH